MRILTISNCVLDENTGSGYVIVNFANKLRERGCEVELLGPPDYEVMSSLGSKGKNIRLALGMLFKTMRRMRGNRYDVVEFWGAQSWLAVWYLSRKRRDCLVVGHSNGLETRVAAELGVHGDGNVDGPKSKGRSFLEAMNEKAFTHVDGLILVSKSDEEYAREQRYLEASKIVGINNSLLSQFLGRTVNFERPPAIAFCGNWLARKGTELIKRDMSTFLARRPEYVFHLIGVGRDFKKEEHFPANVLNQIQVHPFVKDKEELARIYEGCSILILPSLYESFALVVAEAMACGCAIVACHTGYAASLQHGKEAWIMDNAQSPSLDRALETLAADEPLRHRIAEAGYHKAQELSWENAADSVKQLFVQWAGERRTGAGRRHV